MGPRYSNIGAAQALVKAGITKLAIASPDTISAYADGGPAKVAAAAGIPYKIYPTHLPVTDAASQLLQMYQFAGNGGGILLPNGGGVQLPNGGGLIVSTADPGGVQLPNGGGVKTPG